MPVPDAPMLVLSPHFDDAALSCAALLAGGTPLTICDVFTQRPEPEQFTDWDRQCGFEGSNAAMDARRFEEHEAFADSGHAIEAIDLLDGQYLPGVRSEDDARRLTKYLDRWTEAAGAGAIVAVPVGAGTPRGMKSSLRMRMRARKAGTFVFANSPDHLFVRDTALEHLGERDDVRLWLYEDFPYLFGMNGDRIMPTIEQWLGCRSVVHTLAVDRDAKAQRIVAYASQLTSLFRWTAASDVANSLLATERYWELTRSAS